MRTFLLAALDRRLCFHLANAITAIVTKSIACYVVVTRAWAFEHVAAPAHSRFVVRLSLRAHADRTDPSARRFYIDLDRHESGFDQRRAMFVD